MPATPNTTRVVIIDPYKPEVMKFGISDLVRIDGMYVNFAADGADVMQLVPVAYVFHASGADKVQGVFRRQRREEHEMRDRHYAEMVEQQKLYGAR